MNTTTMKSMGRSNFLGSAAGMEAAIWGGDTLYAAVQNTNANSKPSDLAMHFAGTPVSSMANVHCAAATEGFLVLENHSVDGPWWSDLVDGVERPIVNNGYITVPEKPGFGITLNDAVVKQHLIEPGYFEPTPEWNKERANDRLWS